MNKVLLSCLLLLTSPCLFAQDVIIMKDSTKIKARVENISETQIQFRKYGNTDLSTYYVDKKDALKVNFENGDVKNFGGKEKSIVVHKLNEDESNKMVNLQLKYSYWSGKFNLVDQYGGIVKRKMKKREMRELLAGTPALESYQKHISYRHIGSIFGYTGAATALAGLTIYVTGTLADGGWGNENQMALGAGLIGGGLLVELIGVPFGIISVVKGYKTDAIYNRYQGKQREKYSLNFGLTGNGVGLVLSF